MPITWVKRTPRTTSLSPFSCGNWDGTHLAPIAPVARPRREREGVPQWSQPRLAFGVEIHVPTCLPELLALSESITGGPFRTLFPADGPESLSVQERRIARLVVADTDSPRRIGFARSLEWPANRQTHRLNAALKRLPKTWRIANCSRQPQYWILSAAQPLRVVLAARLDASDPALRRLCRAGAERLSSVECGIDIIRTKAGNRAIEVPLRETALRAMAHFRKFLPDRDPKFRIQLLPRVNDSGVRVAAKRPAS